MSKTLKSCMFLLSFTVLTTAVAEAAPSCVGSCNENAEVTVDEIITMVNVALGQADVSQCAFGDADASGSITVDEILTAVNNALTGCTPPPTGLGTRHFELDPLRSGVKAVLAPNFEVTLGNFRGQKNGQVGNAYFDLEGGEIDPTTGLATINVTDASDYIFAQAQIANLTFCLKPLVPVANAGIIDCDGGLDFSIGLSIDHKLGRVGEDGFDFAACTAAGGRVEGPNQVCSAGLVGGECFLNSDCDTNTGTGDGACGLTSGVCRGQGAFSGSRGCNSAADCPNNIPCDPVPCTEGKTSATCRNAGDCDTAPGADDGVCGNPEPHPGVCNGAISAQQIGGDSGPGAVVIAPRTDLGLSGFPMQLSLEQDLPCGDEGTAATQAFAITTGASRVSVLNFSAGDDDLVFDQEGENLMCSNFADGTGGRFGFGFPTLHLNPMSGGDLVIGFTFQGK